MINLQLLVRVASDKCNNVPFAGKREDKWEAANCIWVNERVEEEVSKDLRAKKPVLKANGALPTYHLE